MAYRLWRLPLDCMAAILPGGARVLGPLNDPFGALLESLQITAAAGRFMPLFGASSRELRNKLQAFGSFRQASLQASPAITSGPCAYHGLWAEEGYGYALGRDLRHDPPRLKTVLSEAPRATAVARVSGCGLALAIHQVEASPLSQREARQAIEELLDRFVERVDGGIPSRHRLAALENLGLAVCTLRPEALEIWAEHADRRGFASAFWHGAGRGLYFVPSHWMALPGTTWSALQRALEHSPRQYRGSSVAGLVWALTLVNMRHPQVIAHRLADPNLDLRQIAPWLGQGMAAACMLWMAATGEAGRLEALRHTSVSPQLWPSALSLETQFLSRLLPEDRVAELFQYFEPEEGSHDTQSA